MSKPPALTKKLLEERSKVEADLLKLKRQVDNKQRRLSEIDASAVAALENNDGKELTKCGYVICWKNKGNSVSWKNAFIKVKGEAAALKLQQEAGTKQVLSISKAR